VQNTVLVSAGIIISVLGSYIAVYLVDAKSQEVVINLQSIADAACSAAGFFSESHLAGTPLSFVPKEAVISMDYDAHISESSLPYNQRDILANTTVVFMIAGYVALYLGLRTSEWWTSLAILIISALASITHTVLVPEQLQLVKMPSDIDKSTASNNHGALFYLRQLSGRDVFLLETVNPADSSNSATEDLISRWPDQAFGAPEPLLQACRNGPKYRIIHCTC